MENTFKESDLLFEFNDQWLIKKYDDHPFFRAFSGHGYKGVDFIGLKGENELVLMEVKNYQVRIPEESILITLNNPQRISDAFIKKIEDSLSGINAISRYYKKKWWYNLAQTLYSFFSNKYFHKQAAGFWPRVQYLNNSLEHKVWILLWMETETEYENFSAKEIKKTIQTIEQSIQDYFQGEDAIVKVVNMQSNPFSNSLIVKPIDSSPSS